MRSTPVGTAVGAAPDAIATPARRLTSLRRNSGGISIMLLAQYGLGIGINLYVTLPPGASMSRLPAVVTAHALFGLMLLAAGVNVLIRALLTRKRLLVLTSSAGLLSILGAAISGAMFTGNGRAGASLAMALLTGLAQLCYLINLVAAKQPEPPRMS